MRIYQNFPEAINEIKRDLAEMGILVHPQTMQDKYVADNPDYATKELQNYIYTVINPMASVETLQVSRPWVDQEFAERIALEPVNPGTAYKSRDEVWQEFIHEGKFSYTYSERLYHQLNAIIKELKRHPNSRQLYLGIWEATKDVPYIGGSGRVPCSLGYLFQLRDNRLNITYFMRSCDMITHMSNDIYLACKLMKYVADSAGVNPGNFTHFIGSLHAYAKDMEGVF